jgi:hypothetical protein
VNHLHVRLYARRALQNFGKPVERVFIQIFFGNRGGA